jgi:hypothetical protein
MYSRWIYIDTAQFRSYPEQYPGRVLAVKRCGTVMHDPRLRWSGAHESCDGSGGFGEFHLGVVATLGERVAHAMVKVLVEQV